MVNRMPWLLVLLASEILSLSEFSYLRNLRFDRVEHRSAVPTLFQCADHCSALNICQSFTFDRANKICHISKRTWTIDEMVAENDVVYAEKNDLPQVFAGSCSPPYCAENDICIISSHDGPTCIPFYQCRDRRFKVHIQSTYCVGVAEAGGCDENNIGLEIPKYGLWNITNWEYVTDKCGRSCKHCIERF